MCGSFQRAHYLLQEKKESSVCYKGSPERFVMGYGHHGARYLKLKGGKEANRFIGLILPFRKRAARFRYGRCCELSQELFRHYSKMLLLLLASLLGKPK